MPGDRSAINAMVTALVPSLSRSLAEKFSVFRVMHHGTHEKQLSNVFAWLLRPDGTHGLGGTFQRIFTDLVNQQLPPESPLPTSGYDVAQEVDTSGPDALGKDIADIVLTSPTHSIVVENFETSDGHGHDYYGYLSFGAAGRRRSVVVLLCIRHERQLQTGGWEHSAVVTYAELITALAAHVSRDRAWQRKHPQQHFFIKELVHHFVEEPSAVNVEDTIAFIEAMCETGESARYAQTPQPVAAEEFGTIVARHAERQFEDGRTMLSRIKRALRSYADRTLIAQVNALLPDGHITRARTRFKGTWEWCVELERPEDHPSIELLFGPTVVAHLDAHLDAPGNPPQAPDYTRIFVTRAAFEGTPVQTDIGMLDILNGLQETDTRLRDAVLRVADAARDIP